MVVERIGRAHQQYLNEAGIPKVADAHQGNLKDKSSDVDRPMPHADSKTENRVREQVLRGLDRNGDGVVSQTESIANASPYNQADYFTLAGQEVRNRILEQVLNGLDLNGDGVVSQAEAIVNASNYGQAVPASRDSGKSKDRDLELMLNGEGNNFSILA